MELRLYVQMLQRGWWIVMLTALAAFNVALVYTINAPPVYRASAKFVLSPNESLVSGRDVVTSLEALDKRSIISTYAEVLNSQAIYSQALTALDLTEDDVKEYLHTTVVLPDANVLEVAIEGPDPKIAMQLTNQVGQDAINYIRGLYQVYNIYFLDTARMPQVPVRPQPLRDASLALGLGIVIGSALAIVREQIRTPLEEFLQRVALDSESNAYTRRHIEQRLDYILTRQRGSTLSVGLVQLDGLHEMVGTMPQPIVQRLLRRITQIFKDGLRGNDIVGRWNESTFAVLLPDTPGQAAVGTLGRIQVSLSRPMVVNADGETVRMYPIVGVTERQGDENPLTLVQRAEKALLDASREEGRISLYKVNAFLNI